MSKLSLLLVSILLIAFFVCGLATATYWQKKHPYVSPEVLAGLQANKSVKILSSKIFLYSIATGKVEGMSPEGITLSNLGDSSTFSIDKDVNVKIVDTTTKNFAEKQAKISDIKEGMRASLSVKISSNGQITAKTITIIK